MGAFVSLLQRPPNETGFEAAAEGQNQALNAQALGQQAAMRKEQIVAEQLRNNEARQAEADQNAFRRAYADSGGNLDKFKGIAQQYGVNPAHTIQFEKEILANKTAFQKLTDDEQKQTDLHAKEFGLAAENLLNVPADQRAARYPGIIQDLYKRGHLKGDEYEKLVANPIIDDLGLKEVAAHAKTISDFRLENQFAAQKPQRDATLAKTQGDVLEAKVKQASTALEKAAEETAKTGGDEYARAYYATDPEVAKRFTHPKQFDPQKTAKDARFAGLSPEQRMIDERAKDTADAAEHRHEETMEMQRKRLKLESDRLAKQGQETTAQKAGVVRDANSLLAKYEVTEAQLNKKRRDLSAELSEMAKPDYKAPLGAYGQPKPARDIKGELEDINNQYEQLLADKYEVYGRTGRGEPKVSLQEAVAGIRNGSTPAAPANPSPVGNPPTQVGKPAAAAAPAIPAEVPAKVPAIPAKPAAAAPKLGKYDTALTPDEETKFQAWKTANAPKDSGEDYDLRGAFKAGVKPAANGHWPDTFKKPNHPTFSSDSKYATADAPKWQGKALVAKDGKLVASEYTEDDIRKAATAAKKDPVAAVAAARKRGLIK